MEIVNSGKDVIILRIKRTYKQIHDCCFCGNTIKDTAIFAVYDSLDALVICTCQFCARDICFSIRNILNG